MQKCIAGSSAEPDEKARPEGNTEVFIPRCRGTVVLYVDWWKNSTLVEEQEN